MEAPQLPLFAYGTLTDRPTLEQVLGRQHAGAVMPATLRGYARVAASGFGCPLVAPAAPESVVDGIAIFDLSEADYRLLDEYEDVAHAFYERVRVEVELRDSDEVGRIVPAWMYAAGTSALRGSKPSPSDSLTSG